MRVKYIGTHEAGVPDFPGLWQPGQEQDVTRTQGKYLLASSQFIEVSATTTEVAADAPVPETVAESATAHEAPTESAPPA